MLGLNLGKAKSPLVQHNAKAQFGVPSRFAPETDVSGVEVGDVAGELLHLCVGGGPREVDELSGDLIDDMLRNVDVGVGSVEFGSYCNVLELVGFVLVTIEKFGNTVI